MRRGIIAGTIVCLIFMGGSLAEVREPSTPTKAIWIVDDFEDGNISDWNGPTGPCSAAASGLSAASGTFSLRIDGACGLFGGVWKGIGGVNGVQPSGMTFWVRGESYANDAYVVLGDNSVASNYGVVFFRAASTGEFQLSTSASSYSLGPYSSGQWYRVDLSFDWIGKTVDVNIDGVARQRNVPFRSMSTTAVKQMHFFNFDNSVGWLDQISMGTPPASTNVFNDGFESADPTAWSTAVPTQPQRLVLFDGGGVVGAIGGRSGADVLCGNAAASMTGIPAHATTRAFLSVSSLDEIRDMPAKYGVPTDRPITGPNWNVIAANWDDLLDGSIAMDLAAAGVQTYHDYWYSGSDSDGSVISSYTCSGWTDGSTPTGGIIGSAHDTSSAWMYGGGGGCGECTFHVLCLAWR